MTHLLVRTVRLALEQAADPAKAPQMQAYMKSAMPYRGVPSAKLKWLCREAFKAHPLDSFTEWRRVAEDLWRTASFREERYAAILLTDDRRYASFRTFATVPLFEEMIVTGAWWDFVDVISSHHLGDVLRIEPRRMKSLMRRWASDKDMWKRRAAILCQIRFKQNTDLDLLYACIEPSLSGHSTRTQSGSLMANEFFIRKAIGWALRQYAWTDPKEVRRYVREHKESLSPLSVREALKNIS
jgi:3-methyladenine DNA glycosylase AlkD